MKIQIIICGLMLSLFAMAGETNTLETAGSKLTYWTDTNGKMVVVDTKNKTNIYELSYGQKFLLEMKRLGWTNSASAKPVFTPNVIGVVDHEYQAQRITEVIQYNEKMKLERIAAAQEAHMNAVLRYLHNTPQKTGKSHYFPESGNTYETYQFRGQRIQTKNGQPIMVSE